MPRLLHFRTCHSPLTSSNASGLPKFCKACKEAQERRAVERHKSNPLFLVGSAALAAVLAGEAARAAAFEREYAGGVL